MRKEITILHNKRKIKIIADNCNSLKKIIGLMFSGRENAKTLLFEFKKNQKIRIHSFFVFYPFVAVWLNEKNKITDLKIVNPFNPFVSHKGKATKLIEIPLNRRYRNISRLLVGN